MASTPAAAEGMKKMKMRKMAGNGRFMMCLWDWEVETEKERRN